MERDNVRPNPKRRWAVALLLLLLLVAGGIVGTLLLPPGPVGPGPDTAGVDENSTAVEHSAGDPDRSGTTRPGRRRARTRDDGSDPGESGDGEDPSGGRDGKGTTGGGAGPAGGTGQKAAGAGGEHEVEMPDPPQGDAPDLVVGVVLDSETDEPVVGARTLYAQVLAGGISWHGDTTGVEGRFSVKRPRNYAPESPLYELRVTARGYHPLRVAISGEEITVRLERRLRDPLPGSVRGIVTGADGKPITGRIQVEAYGPDTNYTAQYVIADAAGEFLMEGLEPGHWQMHVAPGPLSPVSVHEGGESRLALQTRRVAGTGPKTLEEIAGRREKLLHTLALLEGEGGRTEEEKERVETAIVLRLQDLDEREREMRARRDVIVTGLPEDAGAHVKLAVKQSLFYRQAVRAGEAHFRQVHTGNWTLKVIVPNGWTAAVPLVVEAGDEALSVDFDALRRAMEAGPEKDASRTR